EVGGKTYQIALRFKRYYKPVTMHLLKFTHEVYTGSNTPKNFASQIQIVDPSRNVDREVKIWMNHPLRYAGETFYQSGFDEAQDRFTILQVVDNPGWMFPYIACCMVALGVVIHFGAILINFLGKQNSKIPTTQDAKTQAKSGRPLASSRPLSVEPQSRPSMLWPGIVVAA